MEPNWWLPAAREFLPPPTPGSLGCQRAWWVAVRWLHRRMQPDWSPPAAAGALLFRLTLGSLGRPLARPPRAGLPLPLQWTAPNWLQQPFMAAVAGTAGTLASISRLIREPIGL